MRPFSLRAEMAAYLEGRDGPACTLCGGPFGTGIAVRTLDHIIPRARGGTDHPANLRLAHFLCNHQRGCPPVAPELHARILAACQGKTVGQAWLEVGVEMQLRRSQRRSRWVRALRKEGALQPGEVTAAILAIVAVFE